MSDLFVDNIKHQSSQGSGTITIGASGETIKAASGTQNNLGIGGAQQFAHMSDKSITSAGVNELLTDWTDITDSSFTADGGGSIGSLVSNSSGTFSFSQTGIYKVHFHCYQYLTGSDSARYIAARIYVTTDNSTYDNSAVGYSLIPNVGGTDNQSAEVDMLVDVTDTSNVKIKLYALNENANGVVRGTSDELTTWCSFIRLGDT